MVQTGKIGLCFLFPFILSACLESAGNGSEFDYIPDVVLECSPVMATVCSQNSIPMFAGLIDNSAIDCAIYLSQTSSTTLTSAFDASGTTTGTQAGGYLTGFVTNWVNSYGSPIDELPDKSFRVCAFVDSNSNNQLDSGEAVGEGQATAGISSAQITDWFNY